MSFQRLMIIEDAQHDKSMIKSWEIGNNVSYTCMKARLHCDDCGFSALVTDFNKKYEDLHIKMNEWFGCTFIDLFLKLLYNTGRL